MNNSVIESDKGKGKGKKSRGLSLATLKAEFKQITWTSKPQLLLLTKVVVISTFAFGVGVYLADLFIKGALNTLDMLFNWVVR